MVVKKPIVLLFVLALISVLSTLSVMGTKFNTSMFTRLDGGI